MLELSEYLERNAIAKEKVNRELKLVLDLLRARREEELGRRLQEAEVDELGWKLLAFERE